MKQRELYRFSFVFASIYFFSMNGLASLPNLSLGFILKEQMKLSPSHLAYLQALTFLAWVIKPVWGFISDSFPILGRKRKPYLLITSLLAAGSWAALSLTHTYTIGALLAITSIAYFAYAFQDVVADGLMIDIGKPSNLTGQFQSIQWCAVYIALIITSFAGGYISDLARKGTISYNSIFGVTALFPILTFFISAWLIQEEKSNFQRPTLDFRKFAISKSIWMISLFLFFWNFSPSFGSPFFYYSVDTLKFSGSFIGILQAASSIGAFLGSFVFGKWITKIPLRKFLIVVVFLGVASILFNFIYFIPTLIEQPKILKVIALVSNFIFGVLNAAIFLELLTLSSKICREDTGATTFAFLMSFYNLGLMGSSALGGFLYPILGLKCLILISALTSLFVLFFIPVLPIDEPLTRFEKRLQKCFFGRAR